VTGHNRLSGAVGRMLLQLARTRLGGRVIRGLWAIIPPAWLPNLVFLDDSVAGFLHPVPSHAFHVLLVPRTPIASLSELVDRRPELLAAVYRAAEAIADDHGLTGAGYRVVVNAGAYQEVELVHFHLISGAPIGAAGEGD
jgi:histidine triad (HIT) family protein